MVTSPKKLTGMVTDYLYCYFTVLDTTKKKNPVKHANLENVQWITSSLLSSMGMSLVGRKVQPYSQQEWYMVHELA